MKHFLLPAVIFLSCGANHAFGQSATILHEDFQNGFPPAWSTTGFYGELWHVAQNGECGAVTNMVAFNHGPAACNYQCITFDATLNLPPIMVHGSVPLPVVTFDYTLEIGALDLISIRLSTSIGAAGGYELNDVLINDGQRHSAMLPLPFLIGAPATNNIAFVVSTDGMDDQGRGVLLDNVRVSSVAPSAIYCHGAAAALCPCGNLGGPLRGCRNSTNMGAALRGSGDTSLSGESLQLYAMGLPATTPTFFFQGSAQASAPFGDGRMCVGGALIRLGSKTSEHGAAVFPESGDPRISTTSNVAPGDTRYYQAMYRDVSGPCGTGFNLSNGWSATWTR